MDRQTVSDGLLQEVVLLKPQAGSPMDERNQVGLAALQIAAHRQGKEPVRAIPPRWLIEWDEKEIILFELLQRALGICLLDQSPAKSRIEAVQQSGGEQNGLQRNGLLREDFFHQIVLDRTLRWAREADALQALSCLQRKDQQVESSGPPLSQPIQLDPILVRKGQRNRG